MALADEAHVGQRVLDLQALEESHAAVDAVRDVEPQTGFLDDPGLGIGPIQHRDLVRAATVLDPALGAVGDEPGFVQVVVSGVHENRPAGPRIGPEVFAEALGVVADQRIGGLENPASRPIVLLEPHHLDIGEVLLEVVDILDLRPTPTVDRLIVVAHGPDRSRAERAARFGGG